MASTPRCSITMNVARWKTAKFDFNSRPPTTKHQQTQTSSAEMELLLWSFIAILIVTTVKSPRLPVNSPLWTWKQLGGNCGEIGKEAMEAFEDMPE